MSNGKLLDEIKKWWEKQLESPTHPLNERLDELESRIKEVEETESGQEKGEKGEQGGQGAEGREGAQGDEGSPAEATVTENGETSVINNYEVNENGEAVLPNKGGVKTTGYLAGPSSEGELTFNHEYSASKDVLVTAIIVTKTFGVKKAVRAKLTIGAYKVSFVVGHEVGPGITDPVEIESPLSVLIPAGKKLELEIVGGEAGSSYIESTSYIELS